MNEKVKKSEQTYEWALAEMQKPLGPKMRYFQSYRLSDIAKRHHTPELMLAALKSGRATMYEVPESLMTRDLYLMTAIESPQCIANIPEKVRDFDFLKEVVSNNPDAFGAAWYWLREDQGRGKANFTTQDVMLAMESIYPTALAEKRLDDLHDRFKPAAFESDEEKALFSIREFFGNAPLHNAPRELLWLGLKAILPLMNDHPTMVASDAMDLDNPGQDAVERVKAAFGAGNDYGVKVWASHYDRDQGISEYVATDVPLEQAMDVFAKAITQNASAEIVCTTDEEETAICIGGTEADVQTPTWVCLKDIA